MFDFFKKIFKKNKKTDWRISYCFKSLVKVHCTFVDIAAIKYYRMTDIYWNFLCNIWEVTDIYCNFVSRSRTWSGARVCGITWPICRRCLTVWTSPACSTICHTRTAQSDGEIVAINHQSFQGGGSVSKGTKSWIFYYFLYIFIRIMLNKKYISLNHYRFGSSS